METNAQTEPVVGSDSPVADNPTTDKAVTDIDKLRADLNKANKSDAERRLALKAATEELVALKQAQADAEAATLAEKGEYQKLHAAEKERADKLSADLAAVQAQAREQQLAVLRHKVAAEKSLPAALIDRLRGETLEELAADADELLKALPRPTAPNLNGGAQGAGRGLLGNVSPQERERILNQYGISTRYVKD